MNLGPYLLLPDCYLTFLQSYYLLLISIEWAKFVFWFLGSRHWILSYSLRKTVETEVFQSIPLRLFLCMYWRMSLSVSGLEIEGGGKGPTLGSWEVPAIPADDPIVCGLAAVFYIWQRRGTGFVNWICLTKQNWKCSKCSLEYGFKDFAKSLCTQVNDRTQLGSGPDIFLKDETLGCAWTKSVWRWLERTDVCSIFTWLWEEMSGSRFL